MRYPRSALTTLTIENAKAAPPDPEYAHVTSALAIDGAVAETIAAAREASKMLASLVESLESDDATEVIYALNRLTGSSAIDQRVADARLAATRATVLANATQGIYR
jgi:hypothetical protein